MQAASSSKFFSLPRTVLYPVFIRNDAFLYVEPARFPRTLSWIATNVPACACVPQLTGWSSCVQEGAASASSDAVQLVPAAGPATTPNPISGSESAGTLSLVTTNWYTRCMACVQFASAAGSLVVGCPPGVIGPRGRMPRAADD